jgi:molybdopterin-guanine dinucleotide biosynthesis protein A
MVVVLAGGAAARLGGAKAALEIAGRPLIEHPLAAARAAGLESIVVAKRTTALPPVSAPVVHEPDEPRHPLRGILTGLDEAAAGGWPAIVAVGCDMPFVTHELLAWLAALDGAALVAVAGRAEPLLARWPLSAREAIAEALAQELSLGATLDRIGARTLGEGELRRFGDPRRLCFNINTPSDLGAARRCPGRG